MKYAIVKRYEVDVPPEGSDRRRWIIEAMHRVDPVRFVQRECDEKPYEPTEKDIAEFVVNYPDEVPTEDVEHVSTKVQRAPVGIPRPVAEGWHMPGQWRDPENGVQHV